ncbi:PolC-type DNA polymerase III [Thalassobacillus sp. CUG 92003]|uniref:3'-5' exonuclease n=1 Tax=Thalassobacillus sp. CUG 92003 TaxID=2736641 RepID=UPI0015E7E386|nr:3'-5' exonuclease [Thalassobacillus sp. CUG 92003]
MFGRSKPFHFSMNTDISLSTRLEDMNFYVFDTEATGFSVKREDRLIELAAVQVQKLHVMEEPIFQSYVDPERGIPEEIVKLTSISNDKVVQAPKAYEVIEQFAELVAKDRTNCLVGHNVGFDLQVLKSELQRADYKLRTPTSVDTLSLVKFLRPSEEVKDLDVYAKMFNCARYERHTALGDALTTASLFCGLIENIRERGYTTWGDLLHIISKERNSIFF